MAHIWKKIDSTVHVYSQSSNWDKIFNFVTSVTLGPSGKIKKHRGIFLFLSKNTFPALKKNWPYNFWHHCTRPRWALGTGSTRNLKQSSVANSEKTVLARSRARLRARPNPHTWKQIMEKWKSPVILVIINQDKSQISTKQLFDQIFFKFRKKSRTPKVIIKRSTHYHTTSHKSCPGVP